MTNLITMGENAKKAERILSCAPGPQKDRALHAIADALLKSSDKIKAANKIDVENGRKAGRTEAFLDRLSLDEKRISAMAEGVRDVAALPDPVGAVLDGGVRPNGLKIEKVAVPLGVIAIIYESRPNVTADAAALCLKAGNCVILRGGSEAINSNKAIANVMRDAITISGLPGDCVQLVEDTSRESARELMRLSGYIDVLIPRGGAGLIKSVVENSTVPVIETGVGNCHIYVDESADINMAAQIIFNAKTSRPSVCNACETMLVHKNIAGEALPAIYKKLSEKNAIVRGDEATRAIIGEAEPAAEEDWYAEYLDYIIACRVVDGMEDALGHIAKYSSGHSECIITADYQNAREFLRRVDSAAVYVNASTRFTDGAEFGMGAEIGISTQKLHARGPMGLKELTSVKYLIYGEGQIR